MDVPAKWLPPSELKNNACEILIQNGILYTGVRIEKVCKAFWLNSGKRLENSNIDRENEVKKFSFSKTTALLAPQYSLRNVRQPF